MEFTRVKCGEQCLGDLQVPTVTSWNSESWQPQQYGLRTGKTKQSRRATVEYTKIPSLDTVESVKIFESDLDE